MYIDVDYDTVTGCLPVSLFVAEDIAKRLTDMVLLYNVVSYRS